MYELIKFNSLKNKWIIITPQRRLQMAIRLYQMSHDKDKVILINKRFRGIEFTEEQLKKGKL